MNIFNIITQVDFVILDFIQQHLRCAFLDILMPFFSFIGESGAIWFLIAIPMLFFKKTRGWGVLLIAAMAFAFLSGEIILKNMIGRPRPFIENTQINLLVHPPASYSFPSGHSSSSFAAAVVLFIMNKKWGTGALALAFLVAFSRLYNYVHFPSDVLIGMLLGVISALFMYCLFKKFKWMDKIGPAGKKEDTIEKT